MDKFYKWFFYSNAYLGFAAIGLCIETNLALGLSLNYLPFYAVVFFATCIYYTTIYIRSINAANYSDRTLWYRSNLVTIRKVLKATFVLTALFLVIIVVRNFSKLLSIPSSYLLALLIFPAIAAWYTFSPRRFSLRKIREIGFVKPFVIGFIWAGWTTVYPVIVWQIQKGSTSLLILPPALLLLQNFLFYSINAIIFDLKDYRTDSHFNLKTFPVVLGIKTTIQLVLIPLFFLNVTVFILYSCQYLTFTSSALQSIPYVLLFLIIVTHKQQKSLLYYLAVVDGLLFVKVFAGIISSIYFKK